MKITYDPEVDALSITFRDKRIDVFGRAPRNFVHHSPEGIWYDGLLAVKNPDREEPIMVRPEELLERLRLRPFEPFAVHLSDGRVFEVRYPEMNLVFTTYLLLGIPEADQPDPFADHFERLDLSLITKIEPLAHSTPAASR